MDKSLIKCLLSELYKMLNKQISAENVFDLFLEQKIDLKLGYYHNFRVYFLGNKLIIIILPTASFLTR